MNINGTIYSYMSDVNIEKTSIRECLNNLYSLLEKNKDFKDLKPSELNYIADVYERGFIADPIKEFYDMFFDKFSWNFLPNSFLYELYRTWHLDNLKDVFLMPRNTFITNLKLFIDNDKWKYSDNPLFLKANCNEDEPLIYEYNLENWIDKSYLKNDSRSRGFIRK